jgi:hypothetical protein
MNFDMRLVALERLSHYLSLYICKTFKMELRCDLDVHFNMNVTMS